MRHCFVSLILCVSFLSAGFFGCSSLSPAEKETFDEATVVLHYLAPQDKEEDGFSFYLGTFKEGAAILGDNGMAFWVKDGIGYVVNDSARKAAPDLEQAPESTKFDDAFISAAMAE